MARPKSDEKRSAILAAAATIFAERGLGAPTSAISSAAEIAEGTLFTYFSTKDELANALYRHIKSELAAAMMSGFSRKRTTRAKFRHIWESFTSWGIEHPEQRVVLSMLQLSNILTPDSLAAGLEPFAEIEAMARAAVAQHILRDIPLPFVAAMIEAAAQTTMVFMAAHPAASAKYQSLGFEFFWRGIARE